MLTLKGPQLSLCTAARHAFFGRQGGASRGPWSSLNMSVRNGDDAQAVLANRRLAMEHLAASVPQPVMARQVHGTLCLHVDHPWGPDELHEADALVTKVPGLPIGVLTADCAPVLLADARAGVIGAAHAGWKGALSGIIEAVVTGMTAAGANLQDIVAAIGPCIGQRSYEVGQEFEQSFLADDPASQRFFKMSGSTGKPHFDLEGYVASQLARTGVGRVDLLGRDTCAEAKTFFSYRRACLQQQNRFGLQLSAILLVQR